MVTLTPCDKLTILENKRFELISTIGSGVKLAEYDAGNGGRRKVEYHQATQSQLRTLDIEIAKLRQECDASLGITPKARRHAIKFG